MKYMYLQEDIFMGGEKDSLIQFNPSVTVPLPCGTKFNLSDNYLIASAKPSVLFGTNSVGVLGTMQSSSSLNGPGAGCP